MPSSLEEDEEHFLEQAEMSHLIMKAAQFTRLSPRLT